MSYDIDMCDGITYNGYDCPFRENCKRYVLGQKALSENYYPIYWIYTPYENGDEKCDYQIRINDEKETEKNGRDSRRDRISC